jgi:hypothetical protein
MSRTFSTNSGSVERLKLWVRLHAEQGEVARHRTLGDAYLRRDGANTPVCPRLRLRGERGAQQHRDALIVVCARAAAPRRVGEPGQPVPVEAPAPVPDRLDRDTEPPRDLGVCLPGGRRQDDLRPAHVAVGERARVGERAEVGVLRLAERQLEEVRPAGRHRGSGDGTPEPPQA